MALKQISTDELHQFDRLSFVTHRAARAGTGGEHVSRRPSPSTDFVDYRPYQAGDDFRRVDWNVYGRLGSLQVKVTEGRERLDVLVVLDSSGSMSYGAPDKLEFAGSVVGALAYVGMAHDDSVRIACLGSSEPRRFGPIARRQRLPSLLSELALIAPTGLVDINAGFGACLSEMALRHPLVVIVSDLLAAHGVADGLERLLVQKADVAVVHVVSPDEMDPRVAGEVELVDAESGELLELGVSMETLAAYRARFSHWLDERAAECRSRGVRYIRVCTDRPLASVMLVDLRRGGLLR